jgi:exopolysaccharide biosynthesis WecB/TagA/CpsF family protein
VQFRFGKDVVAITHGSAAAMLTEVRARLAQSRGFALATINLDHLVKLRACSGYRLSYGAQDIVVADGNPVVWLSRLAGHPVSLVPGSDMVLPLARMAAETGRPVALVGSTAEALQAAAAVLQAAIPGLRIARQIAPPFPFDPASPQATALLQDLEKAGIGLAFLALGAPKQETLAARGRALAPGVGFVSVGAGLDFLAGTQQRAPAIIRLLALDWMWRALKSPRRMVPRYLACAAILPQQVVAALRQRSGG